VPLRPTGLAGRRGERGPAKPFTLSYLLAAALGVIQGLTEFLPVSSSAHLILVRAVFGWDPEQFGLGFDVALHVGTLGAVLYYFRADLGSLVTGVPEALSGGTSPRARQVRAVAVGSVPIIIVGLLAADAIEAGWRTPAVSAGMLVIGSAAMLLAERVYRGTRDVWTPTALTAFAIGCGQAAALVPGVSRAGGAIVVAMLFGMTRESAARFAFLLSIPAMVGAGLWGVRGLAAGGAGAAVFPSAGVFATGMVVAGLVGYLTVSYFIRYLAGHSLRPFAYYRLVVAAMVVVWLIR
jgi:undecaprenyl-diphosphatase